MPWARYQSSPIGQVAGLGAPALRVDGRVLEHQQQVGDLAGLAPLAQRLLQRHAVPVRDRAELRHPEFSHASKATLRPSGSRRALLARPHPLAAAWRVDVADLHRGHADRRTDPPPAAAGRHRGRPRSRRILLATFGNLLLIGAIAPWLARRTWNRRPAAEPAPRRARSSRCSTDRIGTGPAAGDDRRRAAAGLAARPLVVSETEDTEREREGVPQPRPDQRRRRAGPQPRDRQHGTAGRGLLPHLRRRATTAAHYFCAFDRHEQEPGDVGRGRERRSRTPRSRPARAPRSEPASPPGRTSNSSIRFAPGGAPLSGTMNEKYSRAARRGRSSGRRRGCAR